MGDGDTSTNRDLRISHQHSHSFPQILHTPVIWLHVGQLRQVCGGLPHFMQMNGTLTTLILDSLNLPLYLKLPISTRLLILIGKIIIVAGVLIVGIAVAALVFLMPQEGGMTAVTVPN